MKKKNTEQHPHFSVRNVPRAVIERFKLAAMVSFMPMNRFLVKVMEAKIAEMEKEGLLPKLKGDTTKARTRT